MVDLSGRIIKGYELQQQIGSGGFGAVYKAYQASVGREVAVKFILPDHANQPDFIRRFDLEAQLIARLEHPHIVPLHDYWRDPNGAYLVMRWLRGGSLQDMIEKGAVELSVALRLVEQLSAALTLAHRNDIIHRDIKPGNILLDDDGNAYLADFGIAKDLTQIHDSVTHADAVVGSLDYLSPEQARGEPVTPRTDLYSLGVVLYEMLTGEHPFHEFSSVERLYMHINDPLPKLDNLALDTSVQEAINTVIQKATEKDPERRYLDISALAVAFREAVASTIESIIYSDEAQLTAREQETLAYLVDGLSNKEIAERMVVTVATVKWHVRQVFRKLGVRGRAQAIARALELGLVTDPGYQQMAQKSTVTYLSHLDNPYKGLHAFEAADFRDFHGREALVNKLLTRMQDEETGARFLALVGPSGSGKSSVVKAGLIPALWQGKLSGSESWFTVEMLPGSHPLDELEIALMRVATEQVGNLHEQLSRDERGLIRAANLILPDDGSELVIIIDQFEEVFTLVADDTVRQHFLDILRIAVLEPRSRVRVILTMRADFYDQPLHYPEFGDLLRSRMETILPLTAQGLERAVVGPADRVGVVFEQGLPALIVSEMTYQAGALPLLQYALTELFEHREGRLLTHTAYQKIGGAVGALAQQAETVFLSLDRIAQDTARQMFLRLVTLGEGAEDTRRRATRAELMAIAEDEWIADELIDTYVEYRLLSLDNDPATREPTVEVAHEAILREWVRLRQWLDEGRDDIRHQRQLANVAKDWYEAKQDESFLLRGSRLGQFENWHDQTTFTLTAEEQNFLNTSTSARDERQRIDQERKAREADLEIKSRNRLRYLLVAMSIFAFGATLLSVFAFDRQHRAEDAQEEALQQAATATNALGLSEQRGTEVAKQVEVSDRNLLEARKVQALFLADLANQELANGRPQNALNLALESLQYRDQFVQPQSHQALFNTVESLSLQRNYYVHDGIPYGAIWKDDGTQILSWSIIPANQELREQIHNDLVSVYDDFLLPYERSIWGISDEDTRVLRPYESRIQDLMSTCRGIQSCQYRVQLWDVVSAEEIVTLEHDSIVVGASWSPDSSRVLTWTHNWDDRNFILVWDAKSGEELQRIHHWGPVSHAEWNANGTRILSWTSLAGPSNAHVWDAETGAERFTIDHGGVLWWLPERSDDIQGKINGASWNTDGDRVLSWSDNGTVKVWDSNTGQQIVNLDVIEPVISAGWNADESSIYTITDAVNRTVQIWDVSTESEQVAFYPATHTTFPDNEFGIAWTTDGSRALTWQIRTRINPTLWDSTTGEALYMLEHDSATIGASWNSDNSLLAVWSADGSATIWEDGYRHLHTLHGENKIHNVSWSSDKRRILTHSVDNTVQIWDTVTGKELSTMSHDDTVLGAYWSLNEDHILTWALDGTVRIWGQDDSLDFINVHSMELGKHLTTFHFNEWSADESRFFAGYTSFLWVIDAMSSNTLAELAHFGPVQDFVPNQAGSQVLTWINDGTAQLWDAGTGQELLRLNHLYPVRSAKWSQNETRILTSTDLTVHVWDATNGEELTRIIPDSRVSSVKWNEEETHIVTGDLQIWDAETGEKAYDLGEGRWQLHDNLIAHYPDNIVNLIDIRSGETQLILPHPKRINGAVFNHDKSQLLTWVDDDSNSIYIWDAISGELLSIIPTQSDFHDVLWSLDSQHILSWTRDGQLSLWNTTTGEEVRHFDHELVFDYGLYDVEWDHIQDRILTLTQSNNIFCEEMVCSVVHLWDVESGQQLLSIPVGDLIFAVRFSKDKKRILAEGDIMDTARAWLVDFEDLLALAYEKQIVPLPNEARETFFLPTVEPTETPIVPTVPPMTVWASPTVATYTPASAATMTFTPSPTLESGTGAVIAAQSTATRLAEIFAMDGAQNATRVAIDMITATVAQQATVTALASEPLQAPQQTLVATPTMTTTPLPTATRTPVPTITPVVFEALDVPFKPLDPGQVIGFDQRNVFIPDPIQALESEEWATIMMPGGAGVAINLMSQVNSDQHLVILESMSPFDDLEEWQLNTDLADDQKISIDRNRYQVEFTTVSDVEVAVLTGPIRPPTVSRSGIQQSDDPEGQLVLFIHEGVFVSIRDESNDMLVTVIDALTSSSSSE